LAENNNKQLNGKLSAATVRGSQTLGVLLPEPMLEITPGGRPDPTVILRSERLGEGDLELGSRLMKEFLQALLACPEPPQALLCYHSAVLLALEDSPVQDAMRQLEARGCEILVCASSLAALAGSRQLAAGRSATLAELVERMCKARQTLWP